MRSFAFERADDPASALRAYRANARFLAGGTTLIDLMRLDVMTADVVIDINGMSNGYAGVENEGDSVRLGALTRMAEAAEHPILRRDFPAIAQSLALAASPQLRNMATLGGNVLQRTRCSYFRDPSWTRCNKRAPGSGCAALDGVNRKHAVLGVSDSCIAAYPGDLAAALIALDATVELAGSGGARKIPFEALHREPGDRPDVETTLRPGELITAFVVPRAPWTRRSAYLKIRDRQSYAFALASAAVALDLRGSEIREARIALGGVATRPWRAREAEAQLVGKPATAESFEAAAAAAFAGARPRDGNRYKVELGRRTLTRALAEVAGMKV